MRGAVVLVSSLVAYAAVAAACGDSSPTGESADPAATGSVATTVTVSPGLTGDVAVATDGQSEPSTTPSTESSISSTAAPTTVGAAPEISTAQQATVYELVIRDVLVRSENDRRPDVPGIPLVDHPVADAGRVPLSISQSASGESFAPGVLDDVARPLADLPLLDLVGSMEVVLGPEYHPTAPETARPGLLVVVSPIVANADGWSIGVQVGPPGGVGCEYLINVSGETATIVEAETAWIS